MEQKTYNHYRSMDIYGNGVGYNVVIVKESPNGDVYFIREEDLDGVDVRRMQAILNRRDADKSPLWDVMSQVTLKNGMNALEYFHQLVQVRTASGQIISPSTTRQGIRQNLHAPRPRPQEQAPRQEAQQAPQAQAQQTQEQSSDKPKRGPGRPRKKQS